MSYNPLRFLPAVALFALVSISSSSCIVDRTKPRNIVEILIDKLDYNPTDTMRIEFVNASGHQVFNHVQRTWVLDRRTETGWETIYEPPSDEGPARFEIFLDPGEIRVLHLPVLPSGVLIPPGSNVFRFRFGLLSVPHLSSPLPENQRVTPTFSISGGDVQ